MSSALTKPSVTDRQILAYGLFTLFLVSFLFFIDEGYYNFNWMKDIGNWIVFMIYAVPVFACQVLVSLALHYKIKGKSNTYLSIVLGTILALFLVIKIIFGS